MTIFHCREFSVQQQNAAMKICTDSLMFGAMAPINQGDSVLDIGTGCGILSLMAAQLGAGQILALEICEQAYREAAGNFANSPWREKLLVRHLSLQAYAEPAQTRFDVIIANPPFFQAHLKSKDSRRMLARHTDSLSYAELIQAAADLLTEAGLFYLLLPVHAQEQLHKLALASGLHLIQQVDFQGFPGKPVKTSALTLSRKPGGFQHSQITIYQAAGVYTPESSRFLAPFLLKFALGTDEVGLR